MSTTPATCDGCGKVWQIPDPGRAYKCRACGGNVRAAPAQAPFEPGSPESQENAPPPPATITCGLCKTANDAGQRFCTECGAPLSEAPAVPASAAAAGDQVDARIRSREIKSARETLQAARTLSLTNAALMLLVALGAVIKGAPIFVSGIVAGLFAIYVVAAIRIAREPFFWSVVVAALMTLNVASYLWVMVTGRGKTMGILWLVLIGCWAAAGWVLVTAVARSRQLIADNPGLMKVPKLVRGPQNRRALAEGIPWRKAVAVILVLGVAVAAWMSLDTEKKPPVVPPFDATASEFLQAWNASRHADVKKLLPDNVREMKGRRLDSIWARRGWGETLPKATLLKVEYPAEGRAFAIFRTAEGEVLTEWSFENGRWCLSGVQLPYR